ncbi:CotH kinase family protein, partial [Akkermansiaceae bacterium]|nr:CotH kinase family protein [Akkermansiaceae bacterium]
MTIIETFVQNEVAVDTVAGTTASIYYLGNFYDNVQMDRHGQSTGAFPKKSYDLDFNKGNRFLWKEGEERVKDTNLLTNWADKSKVRNAMGYEFLRRCGSPSHYAFPIRMDRNGEFFSITDLVEDGDDRFLDRVGL